MAEKFELTPSVVEDIKSLSATDLSYDVIASDDFAAKYAAFLQLAKSLDVVKKAVDTKIKELLADEYYESGNGSVESASLKISYVPESTSEKFDEKRFKEEHPDMYDQYIKVASRAAYLKTTLREVEK